MKYVLIGLLKLYRLVISPLYGNVCRYYPSCSAYALRAVEVHGAVKGTGWRPAGCCAATPGRRVATIPVPGTPEFDEETRIRRQQVRRHMDSAAIQGHRPAGRRAHGRLDAEVSSRRGGH